ncbi:MAG: energy-coupling factor ABC transporter permease [Coriobacteriia bacterium]
MGVLVHIPDGMLDTKTWVSAWVGSAGALAYASAQVKRHLKDNKIVLMAVLSALVFALQMLNFPVAGGTSGHFAGGAAVAIILGPWPAMIVMTAVLAIQALLFADGGITALGANVVNLAIVGPLLGWLVYRTFMVISTSRRTRTIASFTAAWTACVGGSLSAAVMLWISGRVPLFVGAAAMGTWHAMIGVGEGIITAGLVTYLATVRPDLLADENPTEARSAGGVAVALGFVALVATGLSFLAAASPDGLEYVYDKLGQPFQRAPLVNSPLSDYVLPGVANETLAGVLAGVVGLVVSGAVVYALVRATRSGHTDV